MIASEFGGVHKPLTLSSCVVFEISTMYVVRDDMRKQGQGQGTCEKLLFALQCRTWFVPGGAGRPFFPFVSFLIRAGVRTTK